MFLKVLNANFELFEYFFCSEVFSQSLLKHCACNSNVGQLRSMKLQFLSMELEVLSSIKSNLLLFSDLYSCLCLFHKHITL